MTSDSDLNHKVRDQSIEHFVQRGSAAHQYVRDISIFNQKLVGTLAAGAIVTILTLIANKDTNKEIVRAASGYLLNYLLVLFLATLNAGLSYIQAYAVADEFEHTQSELAKATFNPTLEVTTKSQERIVNILTVIMIIIHILVLGIFFISSFKLMLQVIK